MRHVLALILFLLASGARGQTAPLAERVVGDWANADSVAYPTLAEDGTEITDASGEATFATVYMHLALTDSLYTATTLYWDYGELRGSETTWPYQLRDGQIHFDPNESIDVRVVGDSLILSRADSLGVSEPYVYRRTAPLAPEAVLGDWITGALTDNAGVVFDLPFRFAADGTVAVGYSDPVPYRVLGGHLLLYESEYTDPGSGATTLVFRASVIEAGAKRIVIREPNGETLVLYRRR